MTIENDNPNDSPTVKADIIYSSTIGDGNTVNQTFLSSPRSANPYQLPIDPPNFTGRDREIAQITDRLIQPGQVVGIFAMSGMGGVGKSALAIHVAHKLKPQYPDGQLWLDLRGQSESPLTVEDALRKVLVEGFGEEPGHLPVDLDGLQALYRSRFAGRQVLLVLDNARDGLQVQGLLPGAAGCGVLLTSRERLQLRELSPEQAVPIGVRSPEEALELLGKIARSPLDKGGDWK
jgi:NB-ARC domain